MARIINVDYEAIPAQAQQMRTYGQDLNNELTTAYQSIADMHNSWYGQRYNALVKEFNNIIPQIKNQRNSHFIHVKYKFFHEGHAGLLL